MCNAANRTALLVNSLRYAGSSRFKILISNNLYIVVRSNFALSAASALFPVIICILVYSCKVVFYLFIDLATDTLVPVVSIILVRSGVVVICKLYLVSASALFPVLAFISIYKSVIAVRRSSRGKCVESGFNLFLGEIFLTNRTLIMCSNCRSKLCSSMSFAYCRN